MKFFVGDKVKNTMRDREGVVEGVQSDDVVLVNYGNGPTASSVKYLELLSKHSDVQRLLVADPEALQELLPFVKRIEVLCQESKLEAEATRLSQVSSLSELDALDYIRPVSENSHSSKYSVFVQDTIPAALADRLGVYFHNEYAPSGEVQICSRGLAVWLMRENDMLPARVG